MQSASQTVHGLNRSVRSYEKLGLNFCCLANYTLNEVIVLSGLHFLKSRMEMGWGGHSSAMEPVLSMPEALVQPQHPKEKQNRDLE